ncbi:hypothetical protein [Granulicella mallensis]|jgi:hypothetical protein|uniref:Uncharacterized protein n=1 Tax=Granulicella mallensis (strain ATCC BAA-1857 / DSM 23137 / MP5ACTX8) TaxID=682795 RepID=G8NXW0_GRAMM|nr:hypothetical protein [Granulicella mallensis]AEU34455.1 hypothetical protein AciX8_0097 [Granulicella mallensis MP5ACTX8]
MAQPNIASVSIGSNSFNAIGIHFGMSSMHGGMGMPVMGSLACSIAVVVNLNDQVNVPFATLSALFQLAYGITREKVQDIILSFWADDSKQNAICTYTFRGWISNYVTSTGSGQGAGQESGATNHILTLTLQPELDTKQFVKIQIGN